MKQMGILGIVLVFAVVALLPATAGAETFSISQNIEVRARVAATHTIILDDDDTILEISSNTTEEAVPRVFRNLIAKESVLPLTDEIYAQYRKLVPEGTGRAGLLYKYYQFPIFSYQQKSHFTALISLH
ncbi:hypothetical protein H0X10_03895 [Candidatus Saccharibacteria bacterium]|nr:hypothetical protein [Candidatus Saccharibacteria bacterium]